MAPRHLLYFHGFRSSPRSFKARLLQSRLAARHPQVEFVCPQLPPSPSAALGLAERLSAAWSKDDFAVLGSSLGGFYATVIAERRSCRAVVINPAVNPARDLASHVGIQTGFHDPDESFEFSPGFIEELRAATPVALTDPARYFALIAKGDELLDWSEMRDRYAGSRGSILEGGDHALSDFESHLPAVLDFLGLPVA